MKATFFLLGNGELSLRLVELVAVRASATARALTKGSNNLILSTTHINNKEQKVSF